MKVTDLNLYVGNYNGFKFLICADDLDEAREVAEGYREDAGLGDDVCEVTEFCDVNTQFSCDYVVSKCNGYRV